MITSFKGTGSAARCSNMKVMARMLILVARPQLFCRLWSFVATGNRFVCCAALAGRTGLLIIRDQDAEGQVTLSRQLEIQQIWERLVNAGE